MATPNETLLRSHQAGLTERWNLGRFWLLAESMHLTKEEVLAIVGIPQCQVKARLGSGRFTAVEAQVLQYLENMHRLSKGLPIEFPTLLDRHLTAGHTPPRRIVIPE